MIPPAVSRDARRGQSSLWRGNSGGVDPRSAPAFYSAQAFVAEWIAAPDRVPVARDFTFKAVIGEPDW